jgi:choline dehydrogenase-like flavoprotein
LLVTRAVTTDTSRPGGRRTLEVLTEARVRRILFDGRRAVGVEYERGGHRLEAQAGVRPSSALGR